MSHDEELYKSFRKQNIDTPLWRMLWPTGFSTGATFQENLESVFPTTEMRMRAIDYFQGVRWAHMELFRDIRDVFEFLMLDYRSVSCFVNSSQVVRYVTHNYEECFEYIAPELDLSPLKNTSDFEWSDPVAKANDIIDGWGEETPVGAHPVLYLIFDEHSDDDMSIFNQWSPPSVFMVYFHGEEARNYSYGDCDCTLLEVMLFYGDGSFEKYPWSMPVAQVAMDLIDELLHYLVGQPPWDYELKKRQKARKLLLSARGYDLVYSATVLITF